MDIDNFSISRTNLSHQVADHLEEVILSYLTSHVPKKLPSENKLAKQYNVSRPIIREALKLLQERGLILLRNGSAAFITRPETNTVMNAISRIIQVDKISTQELTHMRMILELASVDLAVKYITIEQLQEIKKILDEFRDTTLPLKKRVSLDTDFHIAIAKASGNNLLVMFVTVLLSLLRDYIGKGSLVEGGIEDGIKRHFEIFYALEKHDAQAAHKAMVGHLKVSSENVEKFDRQGVNISKSENKKI